jgi:hypothetical protein
LLDVFMGTSKENIQHKVCLLELKSLEQAFSMIRKVENKNMATRRVATNNYREHHVPSTNLTQLTRLKHQHMLVSNSSFDLVRNSNPKPSLPALHCFLSFDFNLCFQFVMFHILAF